MSGRSDAAPKLLAGGVADPETIDKVWCIDKEVPEGPFHNLDRVALHTAYDIYAASGDLKPQAAARHVKEHHTDQGKLGQPTGSNTPPPETRHRPLSKTMLWALYRRRPTLEGPCSNRRPGTPWCAPGRRGGGPPAGWPWVTRPHSEGARRSSRDRFLPTMRVRRHAGPA